MPVLQFNMAIVLYELLNSKSKLKQQLKFKLSCLTEKEPS